MTTFNLPIRGRFATAGQGGVAGSGSDGVVTRGIVEVVIRTGIVGAVVGSDRRSGASAPRWRRSTLAVRDRSPPSAIDPRIYSWRGEWIFQ